MLLGRCCIVPTMRLKMDDPAPKLNWVEIVCSNRPAGEVLIASELLLDDGENELPSTPPTASPPGRHHIIPASIRPVLQRMRIEVSKNQTMMQV